MLHSTAARSLSDMQNKCVMLERRTTHELDFVLGDSLQFIFDFLFAPFVSVYDDRNSRRDSRQLELLKFAEFHGTICQRVITRTHDRDDTISPTLKNVPWRRRTKRPVQRGV